MAEKENENEKKKLMNTFTKIMKTRYKIEV